MVKTYDVAVVGGGILGLACALAAVRKGLRVVVIERHAQCIAASVRNFGFVTVSGQRAGAHWARAMRSREVWAEVAPQAGIDILQHGTHLLAQRPEAMAVLEAFMRTDMGHECRLLSQKEIAAQAPYLGQGEGVLFSPHELRVESRDAIKQLSAWLAEAHGVTFLFNTTVNAVEPPVLRTTAGSIHAERIVVCPGVDVAELYPYAITAVQARKCSLNMLRIMPEERFSMASALMSDLSLARYDGFAMLREGQHLAQLLDQEQAEERRHGVHLIVVQSADGSLVVGDSHSYAEEENPWRNEAVDDLILNEYQRMIPGGYQVMQRWQGVYLSSPDVVYKARPEQGVIVGLVTSGTGASTGFAFGEELIEEVLA
ncbi:TIGR03364 family FAD-dependent oxidoreductase [Cardiobacteriaceae bacterium TAE3-ERU3]|nr:TIGR03364 family FAD-dependent oxidoreductase [Cardiobacteriaceae bacterium TAE3-ERU3]